MRNMSTRPVDFDTRSRLIFSVLKKGATTGTANYDQDDPLRSATSIGALAAFEQAADAGHGVVQRRPRLRRQQLRHRRRSADHQPAANSDHGQPGGLLYVTEIYTRHNLITPFDASASRCPTRLFDRLFLDGRAGSNVLTRRRI